MKKLFALLMIVIMIFPAAGCGKKIDLGTSGVDLGFKIGVVTGTVSQGEEEYRAAEAVKAFVVVDTRRDFVGPEKSQSLAPTMKTRMQRSRRRPKKRRH